MKVDLATAREAKTLSSYTKLVRAGDSVTARAHRPLADHGLTISQFGVLEALHHVGPLCQRALGEKILKSSGNMTMVVDNLETRRLVRRERSGDDRRFVTVFLTEEGRRLIREVFPKIAAAIVSEMNVLSSGEQEELGRLCRKLGHPEGR